MFRRTFAKIVKSVCRNRYHHRWFQQRYAGRTFIANHRELEYANEYRNTAWLNERAVELAIGNDYLTQYSDRRVLEVGNVLKNYFGGDHLVLDKYEVQPDVINEDIVDFAPDEQFDLILSLSTLEHVGWDEPKVEPEKIARAVARLRSLLTDDGQLVVTVPLGYNPYLDASLRSGELRFETQCCLHRQTWDNRWKEVEFASLANARYSEPFCNANAIVLGIGSKSSDYGESVARFASNLETQKAA